MQVKLSGFNTSIMVAFNDYAHRVMLNRFGSHDVCVKFEELQAWASGVEKAITPEAQHARLAEGLRFFAARQRLARVDW